VYPGHYLPGSVAAFAVSLRGTEAQRQSLLPALAAGEQLAAWCFAAPGAHGGAAPGDLVVARDGDSYTLRGLAANVQDGPGADVLLVTAANADGSGLSQFLVPAGSAGVAVQELETLDLGRRIANVEFDNVSVGADALLGAHGEAAGDFERQLQVALVLHCAETVGVTDRALEFTLEYVKQRFAFGRPIGSFQALKHRLADHAAQLEGARALVARAAAAVQEQAPDAAIAVSIAKSHCGRCGTEIVRDCLQMHGGIGMTWEHDIQFYLRRVVSNEALWGTPAVHHERLCQLAGL
jgi:alkylation response protein AidB-like acyl-CoA dehydrogenase